MKKLIVCSAILFSCLMVRYANATSSYSSSNGQLQTATSNNVASQSATGGYGSGVQVVLPPQAFTQTHRQEPCRQCCVYNDKTYSEGAVITVKSIVLQCVRDKGVLSTSPQLSWQQLK
jgi:hypothetical protein